MTHRRFGISAGAIGREGLWAFRLALCCIVATVAFGMGDVRALEIRVRASPQLRVKVSAAGTFAQVTGTLRDDLERGLPQRRIEVAITAANSERPVVERSVLTSARGEFSVQEELPPGSYSVVVEFEKTEHLDAASHRAEIELEPKPVTVRVYAPPVVHGRSKPVEVFARASADAIGVQGPADVLVGEEVVGQMSLDATGRGSFDVRAHLQVGDNTIEVVVPGSVYRNEARGEATLRFTDAVSVDATIEERLDRLSRGIAVHGRVYDAAGPVANARIQGVFERRDAGQDVEDSGETRVEAFTVGARTDESGHFVAFLESQQARDGIWKGRARFVPSAGESVEVDAGSVHLDTATFRWMLNVLGIVALLLGAGFLLNHLIRAGVRRLHVLREERARQRRQARALDEEEEIVPVFLDVDAFEEALAPSRDDVGGIVWNVWKKEPVPGARVELSRADAEPIVATANASGRFRFEQLPAGAYQLSVAHHGYIRGHMDLRVPHDGRLSHFRVDLVAVPLKIRRLYQTVVETAAGEDMWGRLSPREIEERLREVLRAAEVDVSEVEREHLRRRVMLAIRTHEQPGIATHELLAAMTEVVEESYYSGRVYGEEVWMLARAIALDLRRMAQRGQA